MAQICYPGHDLQNISMEPSWQTFLRNYLHDCFDQLSPSDVNGTLGRGKWLCIVDAYAVLWKIIEYSDDCTFFLTLGCRVFPLCFSELSFVDDVPYSVILINTWQRCAILFRWRDHVLTIIGLLSMPWWRERLEWHYLTHVSRLSPDVCRDASGQMQANAPLFTLDRESQ